MEHLIYYLAIVWLMIVSAVILFIIALWAYSVWKWIKKVFWPQKQINKRKPMDFGKHINFDNKNVKLDSEGFCMYHTPNKLPPTFLFRWYDEQEGKGLKQSQCKDCGKWLFPSEVGAKKFSS